MLISSKRIFGFAAVVFGILVSATAVAHTDGIYNPTANSVGDTQGIDSNGASAVAGPPVFTFQGAFITSNAGASQTTTTSITTGSAGTNEFFIGVGINSGGISLSSVTLSAGGSCTVLSPQETTTIGVSMVYCTGVPGATTTTATLNWSANPFAGADAAVWTAAQSGFISTAPTGGSGVGNQATATTTTTAINQNAAANGTCLAVAASTSAAATTAFTGTFTYNNRSTAGGNGLALSGADTTGNSVTATSSGSAIVTFSASGNIAMVNACWR